MVGRIDVPLEVSNLLVKIEQCDQVASRRAKSQLARRERPFRPLVAFFCRLSIMEQTCQQAILRKPLDEELARFLRNLPLRPEDLEVGLLQRGPFCSLLAAAGDQGVQFLSQPDREAVDRVDAARRM